MHILELESRRCAALAAGDLAALGNLLADDLVYTHASGRVDSKQSYLAYQQSGAGKYLRFRRDDVRVRVVHSCVAILTCHMQNWQMAGGVERLNDNRITCVWVLQPAENGAWRLASYQSSKIADAYK
jgi:hypothetical protein